MKKITLVTMLFPVLVLVQSCDDPLTANKYNNETAVDTPGHDFIKEAIEGSSTEIKASEVAESKATNPRVRAFAKMMVTDHTAALEKLKKLKAKELVKGPDQPDQQDQKMIDSLSALSGDQFDKAYMQAMVTGHEKAVDLFKEGEEDRTNAVQTCARDLLPKIKDHLHSGKSILASLK
ncbi:DUF4142 domain-containing protein [Mucilaginibacter sp.]|jgi:putative membrane protein|uniref:DUF4142 domain-containing protein n=1 Tax=Mucilaginibacter sp. TaxID=1882438 RepID=UPI002C16CA74|nr:DUF4142 domain-containing protein [Mucilaginibacter sp.]HTI61569.1 DUF4142 domain-containing protein [Mucilaginibacter sp.]